MEVICLQEEAFFKLYDKVIEHLKSQQVFEQSRWVDGEEAMQILKVKSKTTLQKLRDEDEIRFSQPEKKIILYDRVSLIDYIERNSNKPL